MAECFSGGFKALGLFLCTTERKRERGEGRKKKRKMGKWIPVIILNSNDRIGAKPIFITAVSFLYHNLLCKLLITPFFWHYFGLIDQTLVSGGKVAQSVAADEPGLQEGLYQECWPVAEQ